jgi:hypothetical protein
MRASRTRRVVRGPAAVAVREGGGVLRDPVDGPAHGHQHQHRVPAGGGGDRGRQRRHQTLGQGGEVGGGPPVAPAGRVDRVGHGLQGGVGQRGDAVGQGRPEGPQGPQRRLAGVQVPAEPGGGQADRGPADQLRWHERGRRRRRLEGEPAGHLVGEAGLQLGQAGGQAGGPLQRVQQQAAEDQRAQRVQPVGEAGRHPEVAAPAAQRPPQLGLPVVDGEHPAVGTDHLGGDQVVTGRAEAALQPAGPAAQGDPGHPDRRVPPAGHGQPVRLGGPVQLGPGGAPLDPGPAARRVDLDPAHGAQVEDQAAVDHTVPGDAVPTGPDGDRQLPVAGVGERGDHVVDPPAAGDQGRPPVDGAVEHPPGLLVAGVRRVEQLAAEPVEHRRAGSVVVHADPPGRSWLDRRKGRSRLGRRPSHATGDFRCCGRSAARSSGTAGRRRGPRRRSVPAPPAQGSGRPRRRRRTGPGWGRRGAARTPAGRPASARGLPAPRRGR